MTQATSRGMWRRALKLVTFVGATEARKPQLLGSIGRCDRGAQASRPIGRYATLILLELASENGAVIRVSVG
jgi:hypothetical protein